MVEFTDYAFISIGANLPSSTGDPEATIVRSFNDLASLSKVPVLKSSIYKTGPVDSPAGTPDFHNAVAGILPLAGETPLTLLHKLQEMENRAGRTRSGTRNEARTLDLDLILFRQERIDEPMLTVPHPRAQSRKFVMLPLVEIAGRDFRFPGSERTAGEILDGIQEQQIIKVV